jgi:hypothetical protein
MQAARPQPPEFAQGLARFSRAAVMGPVGENFGAACDQIDRSDVMLQDLRERARQGLTVPETSRAGQRRHPDRRPGRAEPREPDSELDP